MPNRLSLRTVVLAAVAAGAVLVPSASAFADATPSPSAPLGDEVAGLALHREVSPVVGDEREGADGGRD
ncbi:hypothetical protein ACFV1Q_11725, partial [Streptomyces sp. NPDC059604]